MFKAKNFILLMLMLLIIPIIYVNKNTYLSSFKSISKKSLSKNTQNFNDLNEIYTLKPDKRFTNSINYLDVFFNKKTSVYVKFINNKWEININNNKINLSKYPDFDEFMNLYKNIINNHLKIDYTNITDDKYKKILEEINTFKPNLIFASLESINKLWIEKKSSKLIKLALNAYINLLIINKNELNLVDNICSKAISLLAILKFTTNEDVTNEEALLSFLLGYSSHSEKIIKNKDTFIYNYITNNRKSIKTFSRDSSLEKILYINLLAKNMESEEVMEFSKKYFSQNPILIASFVFTLDSFNQIQKYGKILPYFILLDLEKSKDDENKEYLENLKDKNVYKVIAEKIESSKITEGIFIDSKIYKSFYSSLTYLSLYKEFLFNIDKLSSYNIDNIIEKLSNSNLKLANDFIKYFNFIVSIQKNEINNIDKISEFNFINNAFFIKAINEYDLGIKYGKLEGVNTLKNSIKYLDSRTSDKLFLQEFVKNNLFDLIYWEELLKSIIVIDKYNNGFYRLYYEFANNNTDKFNKLLNNDTISEYHVAKALKFFGEKILDKEKIIKNFDKIIVKSNLNWKILSEFINFLEKSMEYDKAIYFLNISLLNKNNQTALKPIFIKTAIARNYYYKKEYKKALEIITPLISSYQAGAMERAIEILISLKKYDEAKSIAKDLISRYPYLLRARITYARIYWSSKKYKEAAIIIKNYPHKITNLQWHSEIAPQFSDIFKEEDKEEILQAFLALKKENFDIIDLNSISNYLSYYQKRNDAAFLISLEIKFSGMGKFTSVLRSYVYLKKFRGEEVALKWLTPQIDKKMYNFLSMIIFDSKEYDLLWTLIKEFDEKDSDIIWLTRASAYIITKNQTHKNELIKHYETTQKNHYDKLGAYLMGLKNEKEIIDIINTDKKRCEVSYYLGLKAESNKKYQEASKWYHISILTGLKNNGEYRWAYDYLFKLNNTQKTFKNGIEALK